MAKAPLGTVLALLLCSAAAAQQTVELSAQLLDPFAFRHIGRIGNRVSAVAGVPGDEGTKPDERPDWRMPAEGWRPLPDARPTDQQGAVWRRLQSQLAEQEDRFEATLAGPLADLNRTLADAGFLVLDPR